MGQTRRFDLGPASVCPWERTASGRIGISKAPNRRHRTFGLPLRAISRRRAKWQDRPPYRANPGARRAVPDLPCATGTIAGVDRKRISVMYTPLTMLMMPRGFNDAIIMRSQQAFVFRKPNRAARETALSVLSTEMIVSTTPGTVEQGEQ